MPFLAGLPVGPLELFIILGIVVVLFGATRIGDIGKGVGRGIREFRREVKASEEEGKAEGETEKSAKSESAEEAKSYAGKVDSGEEPKSTIQH